MLDNIANTVWADRAQLRGTVDFSMMFAAHDAFLRDLLRMQTACEVDRLQTPGVAAGWAAFTRFLHIHHTAEDTSLWPPLREALLAAGEATGLATMDAMEAEHAAIDPLLGRLDAALARHDSSGVADALATLTTNLIAHMRHEERAALPLVEAHLGPAGWTAFARAVGRSQGLRNAAQYLPWLLDDMPPLTQRSVFAQLPAPARVVYRLFWAPSYRRSGRWQG
jgi:iron-sulfur cluster repair protein YtfE (RIC family)